MSGPASHMIVLPFGFELHIGAPANPGEVRFEHSAGWARVSPDGEWVKNASRNRHRITRWFGIAKTGLGFFGFMRFAEPTFETASDFALHDIPEPESSVG